MFGLAETFSKQNELINCHGDYKNEFETIKLLHTLPADQQKIFNALTKQLLYNLDQPSDEQSCAQRSRSLREEGNRVYKSKLLKNNADDITECLLAASRLYTQAILAAENAYDELCLGYANRGIALQDFGYFQQAYDDCACAIEFGYPAKLQHKLVMRQAYCAWKMNDAKKLEEHTLSLKGLQLNESYSKQLKELQRELELMDIPQKQEQPQEPRSVIGKNHKIILEPGSRGRHMVATESINRGDLIFTERAECFVPIEQRLICQQCASSLMCAPIPCPECHQRVVYCSRRCRWLHAAIHKYECSAYRRDLLSMLGVSHLAMRLLLQYLHQWLLELKDCNSLNGEQLWIKLMSLKDGNGKNESESTSQAIQSLRMISHLDKVSPEELIYHALCANLLQVYLLQCTQFYDTLTGSSCKADWHIVIAALILRNAGQLLVNGHVGDAIVSSSDFALLEPSLWQRPYHLRLGCLHKFANSTQLIMAINLPYLSLCNHSCAPSLRTKFNGCEVSNYAAFDIKAGEEIFNCYTMSCRHSLCSQRQEQLESIYKFSCQCAKCVHYAKDVDYLLFHRYCCERAQCADRFVPQLEQLSWWQQPKENVRITCTGCKQQQQFKWYDQFLLLLERCHEMQARRQLYKAFDDLGNWLLDFNSLRLSLAKELIVACFAAKAEGTSLDDTDYFYLSTISEYQLAGIAAQSGKNSHEYICQLTYLLDLIAWRKHKSNAKQLKEMRETFECLASETRQIFVNYYNDFIEQ